MHKKAAMLEDRGVIRVSGADATVFLQGLLTNDVERLEPGEARYAALLTPQGKILFDMIVIGAPGDERSYFIDCATAQAADLARRLGFYKLRAKVLIADESAGRAVVAFWGDEPPSVAEGLLYADPRDPVWGGARSCRARSRRRLERSTPANTRACASPSARPRAASTSPMATPSRTTPISIF